MTLRIPLSLVVTAVAVLAADCAILAAIRADGQTSGDFAMGVLPMGSVVVCGLAAGLAGLRRGIRRPFLVGFTALGTAGLILYGAACLWAEAEVRAYAQFTVEALLRPFHDRQPEWLDFAALGLVLSLPQLFLALLGGWVMTELAGMPAGPSRHAASSPAE